MLKKITFWIIAYSFGIFTIQLFPVLKNEDISLFISELIINPLKFFVGVIMFMVTILALSSFITSAIEKTFYWIKRKRKFGVLLILDYSIVFCYYLLFERSFLITVCFLIFSVIYSIISVDLDEENQYGVD